MGTRSKLNKLDVGNQQGGRARRDRICDLCVHLLAPDYQSHLGTELVPATPVNGRITGW